MPGLGEGFGPAGPLKKDRTQMRVWAMQSRTGFWGLSRGTQAGAIPDPPTHLASETRVLPASGASPGGTQRFALGTWEQLNKHSVPPLPF